MAQSFVAERQKVRDEEKAAGMQRAGGKHATQEQKPRALPYYLFDPPFNNQMVKMLPSGKYKFSGVECK